MKINSCYNELNSLLLEFLYNNSNRIFILLIYSYKGRKVTWIEFLIILNIKIFWNAYNFF